MPVRGAGSQSGAEGREDSVTTWLPIRYREFYDVPRSFVVEHGGASYLFDCVFDEKTDDYPGTYQIYRLARDRLSAVDAPGSWAELAEGATHVGEIPTAAVRFDETRRQAVQDEVTNWLPRDAAG